MTQDGKRCSMSFSLEDIKSLARLAHLSLTSEEIRLMQKDLNEVVGYIESLEKVNIDGVEPMTHAVPVDLPLRKDEVQVSIGRIGLMGSAGYEDGLVKVPKIIE